MQVFVARSSNVLGWSTSIYRNYFDPCTINSLLAHHHWPSLPVVDNLRMANKSHPPANHTYLLQWIVLTCIAGEMLSSENHRWHQSLDDGHQNIPKHLRKTKQAIPCVIHSTRNPLRMVDHKFYKEIFLFGLEVGRTGPKYVPGTRAVY